MRDLKKRINTFVKKTINPDFLLLLKNSAKYMFSDDAEYRS